MMSQLDKLTEAVSFLRKIGVSAPEMGIVLGTGLSKLTNSVTIELEIEYSKIPHFPLSTVEFHAGKLIYGNLNGKKVLLMQGRFHLYEGYSAQEVVFPIRVMKLLGIKFLILTNAAGGINLDYKKGELVLIDDHINLLPKSPLVGKNIDELGERFSDMSAPYDKHANQLLQKIAEASNHKLKTGVYSAVVGPNLETRAEYRFLKIIGADLVGMSTVPEVIAANHMSLPCVAISIVTDSCDPDNLAVVDIQEIIQNAEKGEGKLIKIVSEFILKYDA